MVFTIHYTIHYTLYTTHIVSMATALMPDVVSSSFDLKEKEKSNEVVRATV